MKAGKFAHALIVSEAAPAPKPKPWEFAIPFALIGVPLVLDEELPGSVIEMEMRDGSTQQIVVEAHSAVAAWHREEQSR